MFCINDLNKKLFILLFLEYLKTVNTKCLYDDDMQNSVTSVSLVVDNKVIKFMYYIMYVYVV